MFVQTDTEGVTDRVFRTTFAAAGGNWAPWVPIPSLNRTDADVTIFFISFNNIEFVGANDDPIFSAHIKSKSTLGVPVWKPDQNVSVLACAEQNQFCNPNVAQGSPSRCTKLTASELLWENNRLEDIQLLQETDVIRLHNTSIGLNPFQEVIAGYASSAASVGVYFGVFSRGVSALKGEFRPLSVIQHLSLFPRTLLTSHVAAETVYQNVQSPIPNDQWIVELSNWFAVSLAGLQQSSLEYAMGPQFLGESGVLERPAANDTLAQRLCHSQLIRNSASVQSFSMLGIGLILTLGGLILIISVTMESTVSALQRRFGMGELRRLDWMMDEKLHLISMSDEADLTLGGGTVVGLSAASKTSLDTTRAIAMEKKDTSQVALLDLDCERSARRM